MTTETQSYLAYSKALLCSRTLVFAAKNLRNRHDITRRFFVTKRLFILKHIIIYANFRKLFSSRSCALSYDKVTKTKPTYLGKYLVFFWLAKFKQPIPQKLSGTTASRLCVFNHKSTTILVSPASPRHCTCNQRWQKCVNNEIPCPIAILMGDRYLSTLLIYCNMPSISTCPHCRNFILRNAGYVHLPAKVYFA